MLLEILISFGIVVILGCIAFVIILLPIKMLDVIERYLNRKRNDLGEEKYNDIGIKNITDKRIIL